MTGIENPDEMNPQGGADDAPGWGLPSPDPETPAPASRAADDDAAALTPVQQAVVNEVAAGQRELGHEMRWRRRSALDLFAGGGGGGVLGSVVDSAFASQDAKQVAASERDAQILAGTVEPGPDADPHFPAGGPPTPEEVHEAEMNPWPHHGMAETIEHNRQLRQQAGESGSS
jgi:hypothetical protein